MGLAGLAVAMEDLNLTGVEEDNGDEDEGGDASSFGNPAGIVDFTIVGVVVDLGNCGDCVLLVGVAQSKLELDRGIGRVEGQFLFGGRGTLRMLPP